MGGNAKKLALFILTKQSGSCILKISSKNETDEIQTK